MAVRLSDPWLEELRMRSSLEEIVSEYVPLKQKGRRYWGCCPFHNEKTPSFSVDTEAQLFYCFGCHKGGTVIQFVMDIEHMPFMEAVEFLAERAHMEMPKDSGARNSALRAEERERLYEANRFAARYFHRLLWQEEGADALKYFYGRGLNDSDIRRFGLGASPKDWTGLTNALKAEGYTEGDITRIDLAVAREGRVSDRFHDRAMFPIIDAKGHVLGFGARTMGGGEPKYLNTADTPVFNKRHNLYGLNWAKAERAIGHLVLVEGYMDTLSLRKAGVQGVVATLGTALTPEQARLMRRFTGEVWISYDGDPPGQKAALRALSILDEADIATKVIDYPKGMDPDDFIRANGRAGFDALPKYPGTDYRLLRAKDGLDLDTQAGMTAYATAACDILRGVRSPIELENYLRRLVNETGYDKDVLMRQINAGALQPARNAQPRRIAPQKQVEPVSANESALLTMLSLGRIPATLLAEDDFTEGDAREWARALIDGESPARLLEGIGDEGRRARAMQALNYEPIPEDREGALHMAEDCIAALRHERMEARARQIESEIARAEGAEKRELYAQLEQIYQAMDA